MLDLLSHTKKATCISHISIHVIVPWNLRELWKKTALFKDCHTNQNVTAIHWIAILNSPSLSTDSAQCAQRMCSVELLSLVN